MVVRMKYGVCMKENIVLFFNVLFFKYWLVVGFFLFCLKIFDRFGVYLFFFLIIFNNN